MGGGKSHPQRLKQLDFIKGVAIILVILHHAIIMKYPTLNSYLQYTIGHDVPLFLIVTCILYYSKYEKNINSNVNYERLLKTLVIPFLAAEAVILPIAYHFDKISIFDAIISLGKGMGTYYVAIFFQMIVLSKYMFKILKKNFMTASIGIVSTHIFSEIIFQLIHFPYPIYRLLCTRYISLFVIAYVLFKKEYLIKYKNIFIGLAIIGFVIQICVIQFKFNFFLYDAGDFNSHKFYRDFISLWVFNFLWGLYDFVPNKFVCYCGRYSYIIYIIQMVFFPYLIRLLITLTKNIHWFVA